MSVSGEDRPSSSNYRGDTDEESYKPDISDASSVILLICGCGALLSSIFVALSIRRYGTNSASSKLVFMINCAQGMAIFSKLPFVFNNISYGCTISQIILLYAFTQLWLVSYMMLLCTNHLKLDLQSTVYSSSELGLNKKYELFLYISPFFASILPITADAFEEKYNWCVTNPNVHNGSWMLAQAVLFMLIIFSFMGRQVWVIYKRAQECAAVIPPKKIIERIMKGPFVYAIVTIIFGFVGVILIRGSDNLEDDTTKKAYYVSYAIVYLFFVPGYINFFLFFVERRHLKMFESHVAEVKEFETGFDFEDISDNGNADDDDDDEYIEALSQKSEKCDLNSRRSNCSLSTGTGKSKMKKNNGDLVTPLFDFEENGF